MLMVRFIEIGEDIEVHLNGGIDYKNASIVVIEGNSTVQVGEVYSIDQETGLVITIHSTSDGSENTAY